MIRPYKDELEKSGIYIDSIMGPYGGYVLNQGIRLPERKFKKKDYERCHRNDGNISATDLFIDWYIENYINNKKLIT